MAALLDALEERKQEFYSHLSFAKAMEDRVVGGEPLQLDEVSVSVRHVMTIKSGLVIHLYNIVEALMTRAIKDVAAAVQRCPPDEWSEDTLREWLRFSASIDLNGNEDSRLQMVHGAAKKLLKIDPVTHVGFKKPSGTWSDKVIKQFANRLNVNFPLNRELSEIVREDPKYGGKTPLEFLADRRNQIAHGVKTFEHGAQDLTLGDISDLARVTITYMEFAISAFEGYLNDRRYLLVVN